MNHDEPGWTVQLWPAGHFSALTAWTKPADFLQFFLKSGMICFWANLSPVQQITATFVCPITSQTAKKGTPVEHKPLIYQPREAKGSPEKAGQCCHFQSDWHWAVSLHSTVHDSALVANTGSSVTATVQSKIAWKHEWMIYLIHKKVMLKVNDACQSTVVTWKMDESIKWQMTHDETGRLSASWTIRRQTTSLIAKKNHISWHLTDSWCNYRLYM